VRKLACAFMREASFALIKRRQAAALQGACGAYIEALRKGLPFEMDFGLLSEDGAYRRTIETGKLQRNADQLVVPRRDILEPGTFQNYDPVAKQYPV
jgi:hypothetical protein